MKYLNKKDNRVVTLVKKENGRVMVNDGESDWDVSDSTFKRWYSPIKEDNTQKQPTQPKTAVAVLEKPKTIVKETIKAKKEAPIMTNALIDTIISTAITKGCSIIKNKNNIALKINNKNAAIIHPRKELAVMFFNPSTVDKDYFKSGKVERVPESWNWTLEAKVNVDEKNLKIVSELLDLGIQLVSNKNKEVK